MISWSLQKKAFLKLKLIFYGLQKIALFSL